MRLNLLWLIIYFIFVGLISIIFIGQDMNFDLQNYHFYNPYMLLNGRLEYDFIPCGLNTFLNALFDIPFFVAVYYMNIPPIWIGFIIGGIHGINIWLIHNIVYFSLKNITYSYRQILSVLTALTSIFGAGYFSEIGGTMGDDTISLFVLSSLLILSYSFSKSKILGWQSITLSGFIMGLGAGLKLTACVYSIGLVVAILFVGNNIKQKIWNSLCLISGILAGFLVTASYWMIELWKSYSSPLFPMFNKIFQSPYANLDNFKDKYFHTQDIWETLFFPFFMIDYNHSYSALDSHFRDIKLAIAYLFIVVFIVNLLTKYIRSKNKLLSFSLADLEFISILVPFFIVSYILWQQIFCIYRYIIPLELLTPSLVVILLNYFSLSQKSLLWNCLALFTLMIVTVRPCDWGRLEHFESSYFGIDSHSLVKYDKSIIVVWGQQVSYVIPYFPIKTRFVNARAIWGDESRVNFEILIKNPSMEQKIKNILQTSKETPIYLLEQENNEEKEKIENFMKAHNLEFSSEECNKLVTYAQKSRFYTPIVKICKLEKRL